MYKCDWFRYYKLKMKCKYNLKFDIFFSLLFIIGHWRYIYIYHRIQKSVTDLKDNMTIILDPLLSK
jgi:hypothetical protein